MIVWQFKLCLVLTKIALQINCLHIFLFFSLLDNKGIWQTSVLGQRFFFEQTLNKKIFTCCIGDFTKNFTSLIRAQLYEVWWHSGGCRWCLQSRLNLRNFSLISSNVQSDISGIFRDVCLSHSLSLCISCPWYNCTSLYKQPSILWPGIWFAIFGFMLHLCPRLLTQTPWSSLKQYSRKFPKIHSRLRSLLHYAVHPGLIA